MKENELMIGDLVYLIDETSKVRDFEITQVSTERVTGIIVDANNSYIRTNAADTYYNEERYRFIPLTPKILEKNGFELKEGETGMYGVITAPHYICDSVPFEVFCDGEPFAIWFKKPVNIKFVHQLQHALRLCEIKKEIIL